MLYAVIFYAVACGIGVGFGISDCFAMDRRFPDTNQIYCVWGHCYRSMIAAEIKQDQMMRAGYAKADIISYDLDK